MIRGNVDLDKVFCKGIHNVVVHKPKSAYKYFIIVLNERTSLFIRFRSYTSDRALHGLVRK